MSLDKNCTSLVGADFELRRGGDNFPYAPLSATRGAEGVWAERHNADQVAVLQDLHRKGTLNAFLGTSTGEEDLGPDEPTMEIEKD
jgi:hypothetical protein